MHISHTCLNCTCYTCSYDKSVWDMSQYNKLSDIQYARFQILPMDIHFRLFWSAGIPTMVVLSELACTIYMTSLAAEIAKMLLIIINQIQFYMPGLVGLIRQYYWYNGCNTAWLKQYRLEVYNYFRFKDYFIDLEQVLGQVKICWNPVTRLLKIDTLGQKYIFSTKRSFSVYYQQFMSVWISRGLLQHSCYNFHTIFHVHDFSCYFQIQQIIFVNDVCDKKKKNWSFYSQSGWKYDWACMYLRWNCISFYQH